MHTIFQPYGTYSLDRYNGHSSKHLENVSERRIYLFVARRTWDVGAPEVGDSIRFKGDTILIIQEEKAVCIHWICSNLIILPKNDTS